MISSIERMAEHLGTGYVVPLTSRQASLKYVGGKALSLTKLATAGLPIPDGFVLATSAYQAVVEHNALHRRILQTVESLDASVHGWERAEATIQSLFLSASIPAEVVDAAENAYRELDGDTRVVAVRSSATAEDLPDMSFAGQHDSLLNVEGEDAFWDAIRLCWASLWSAQAIAYRHRMQMEHASVAMAVIIQTMVQADVSGVLFTANPATGERSALIVNANYGLGESVVRGQVIPDTFVLDRDSLELRETQMGSKEVMVVADQLGTQELPVPAALRTAASVSHTTLRTLGLLSLDIETLFSGTPQDIEWSVAEGKCWLLQARPITNLPPDPERFPWTPPTGGMLVRRQVVEHMPTPLSPLFEDLYLTEGLEQALDKFMDIFHLNFDAAAFIERPLFLTVNGYAYSRASYRLTWRLLWVMPRILIGYLTVLPRLMKHLTTDWREQGLPEYLAVIEAWSRRDVPPCSDAELLRGMDALTVADAHYWFWTSMIVGAAKVTDGMLNRYLRSRWVSGSLTSGHFLRGYPSKTLEAQEVLERIASDVRAQPELLQLVTSTPPEALLDCLDQEPAGQAVRQSLTNYLEQFGGLIYNLDFAEPTQLEDPVPILLSLKVLVERGNNDIGVRQTQLAAERDRLIDKTVASLGPFRRWVFRKLLGWAQHYGPFREEALFYTGAGWPTLRRFALELGERLVNRGILDSADAIFYLRIQELRDCCRLPSQARFDLKTIVAERRALRDDQQRLHPPGILPEGSRWKLGLIDLTSFETQRRNTDVGQVLQGFAISPGTVTATASVITSPSDFGLMRPDTILVCPTTTPAWTPLFGQAQGLVTDIGGILAHGSIIAREYGIPAVMGTGNGSQRIRHGQTITVDGNRGTVTLVD